MQDDAEQAERFRAIEFVAHRLDRLSAQRGVGGREVDQVAGVRDDRADARRLDARRGIRAISSAGRARPRHWLAFFVKI